MGSLSTQIYPTFFVVVFFFYKKWVGLAMLVGIL